MADGGKQTFHETLKKARKCLKERNYGVSFDSYVIVCESLCVNDRRPFATEFSNVLQLWVNVLHQMGKFDEICRCYDLARTYFPANGETLLNLGIHALSLKYLGEAKKNFQCSLWADPNSLPADQNMQGVNLALVERWHFPMLNDLDRNKSYAQAIFRCINDGHAHILDVRSGTGILSLFASKSKQCKSIVACEDSDIINAIATQVFKANNATLVKLIKKRANHLTVPDDLPIKATLLLVDILDCGIFRGNILRTMVHAWDHLLMPFPDATVIPAKISIYVTGIASAYISKKVRLLPRENNLLNINQLKLINSMIPHGSEFVRNSNVKYITNTLTTYVDFNNIQQLKSLTKPKAMLSAKLKCKETATIEMFLIWYTLNLNESVTITNAPNAPTLMKWSQAVTHLEYPIDVKENDELDIKLTGFDDFIEVKCAQQFAERTKRYLVHKSTILFLNDFLLMDKIEEISKKLLKQYHRNVSVLDLCPFPILGLLLVKAGARLTCRVADLSILNAILHFCKLNHINHEHITFVKSVEFNSYNSSKMRKYNVIFQNLINEMGVLDEMQICHGEVMKSSLTARGTYLPYKIDVWAQLVDCVWLDRATKIDDGNVYGFKIAPYINDFKSTQLSDMDFDALPHTCLCEPVNLGPVNLNILCSDISSTQVRINQYGTANAVFYWFEIELIPGIKISTRRPDALTANAAFLLHRTRPVVNGNVVSLCLKQHKGILKIFINR